MTAALRGASLDPGLGLFHLDADGRSSAALDAMEPIRPFVDLYVATWLMQSTFALADFHDLRPGEVRLTQPLRERLAATAPLWRRACEAVAAWLASAFAEVGRIEHIEVAGDEDRALITSAKMSSTLPALPAPMPPLPDFFGPVRGRQGQVRRMLPRLTGAPRSCWECGRALGPKQRKFCGSDCSIGFHMATAPKRYRRPALPPSLPPAPTAATLETRVRPRNAWRKRTGEISLRGEHGMPNIHRVRDLPEPGRAPRQPHKRNSANGIPPSFSRNLPRSAIPRSRKQPAFRSATPS